MIFQSPMYSAILHVQRFVVSIFHLYLLKKKKEFPIISYDFPKSHVFCNITCTTFCGINISSVSFEKEKGIDIKYNSIDSSFKVIPNAIHK